MVLAPPTCLEACDCWRFGAHALGHFHLRQPSLLTGTHESIEECEFFSQRVILLAKCGGLLPGRDHVIMGCHGVPPAAVSGQAPGLSGVSSGFS
jgi:hypothetical protein